MSDFLGNVNGNTKCKEVSVEEGEDSEELRTLKAKLAFLCAALEARERDAKKPKRSPREETVSRQPSVPLSEQQHPVTFSTHNNVRNTQVWNNVAPPP